MRFYLIGFMGCGKSFWAKKMSELHHMPLIDLDEFIEQKEHDSISNIFNTKGEVYFRERESYYLNDIIEKDSQFIMATGGGTPCFHENMNLMNQTGITILLDASADLILSNLKHETSHRPLIDKFSEDELVYFIERKLAERKAIYNQSKYIIDMNHLDESIFTQIITNHV